MRLVIEPHRLKNFLSAALIHKGKAKLSSILMEFGDKGVKFNDVSLADIAVMGAYGKRFFLEYESGKEDVPVTSTLLDGINRGFGEEKMTLLTDEGMIVAKGSRETYSESLLDKPKVEFPLKVKVDDTGYTLEKMEPVVKVLLPATELSFGTSNKYLFKCDGKDLTVTIEDVGEYVKRLRITKSKVMEELSVEFNDEYYSSVVGNLTGDVWLSMSEEGALFSHREGNYMLSYSIGSLEVPQ